MRQPSSQRNREHGYLPHKSSSKASGSHSQQEPDVVVNGRGNDSSGDSVGSSSHSGHRGRHSPHGLEVETKASRLGQAANPNRAEMPSTTSNRRPSYDPVRECVCFERGGGERERRERERVLGMSISN